MLESMWQVRVSCDRLGAGGLLHGLAQDGFQLLRGCAAGVAQVYLVVLASRLSAALFDEVVELPDRGAFLGVGADVQNLG